MTRSDALTALAQAHAEHARACRRGALPAELATIARKVEAAAVQVARA